MNHDNPTTIRLADPPPGTPQAAADARELVEVFGLLHEHLKRLLALAERKLEAMRSADAEDLNRCAREEAAVLERLFQQEKRRNAILARLAQALPKGAIRNHCLSEIAGQIPEPFASKLRAKTAGLRNTAARLQQKNQLAARVARDLHHHIRAVFRDLAGVGRETVVYGPRGQHEEHKTRNWVDAVG